MQGGFTNEAVEVLKRFEGYQINRVDASIVPDCAVVRLIAPGRHGDEWWRYLTIGTWGGEPRLVIAELKAGDRILKSLEFERLRRAHPDGGDVA